MKKLLAGLSGLVLVLVSGAVVAQGTGFSIGAAAGSVSSTHAAVAIVAGGAVGGTGDATVTATNLGASTSSIPTPVFLIPSTPVDLITLGTAVSSNVTTVTGTATGTPGSVAGALGAGVGASFSAVGQVLTVVTAGPLPPLPAILPILPIFIVTLPAL